MSLLNQVLRDLDNRRASALERQRIPGDVRPLSALKKRGSPLTFFSIAAIFLAAAAVLGWLVISLVSRGDGDTVAVVEHAPWPGVVPSNTVPSNTVPNNTIVQHELKLDASEIFASGRPATRSVTLERPSPLPLAQADKASGSIKGVPIDDFKASAANENSANIVVTPRHADQEGDNFRRAQGLIEQGAAANAELLLRQILTANPAHQVARQSLFNLLVADHRVEEAATVLADGLRIDPARTGWAMNLARMQIEQGSTDAAWETLQHSLPHAAKQADYQAFCGTVLQKLKKYSEAAERYRIALQMNPAEGRWWIGLSVALESEGKTVEAHDALLRAQAAGRLSPELSGYVESRLRNP